ncbi:MAG: 50S ribosomal protein L24 ['Candidatus Kapabacteria' thiocyanatum]|uniref:Large ribosomal subunit protein uL24 n=1 Tax=Candidatus Kapaibacterium thiocyanatum TaxID=1895771 RepID=A0A1M3KWD8_9BACT|nr:50S ribosomal protein L24 ['Candidatus Kapabacteria' thiocyanatum]OJX56697.1 MAG: 50S ribosomal protein L24 ['Candidatus Kapabacteria' thiocyanatum]
MKLKIKKGDTVKVIAGNDNGKTGRVLMVFPDQMKVLVEGVNIRSKAVRPSQSNPNGGIVKQEVPIHYSNVMLVDKNGKPTRTRIERTAAPGGKATVKRVAKTTNEEL